MAFEDMTYETLLERMIQRVASEYPNLDVREGSMLYNSLAGAAVELAIAYTELDNILNESFVQTASRDNLYLSCEEIGMDTSVFNATAGTFQGEFNVEVPVGSRWNCGDYNYTVDEFIEQDNSTNYYKYSMSCETLGAEPNAFTGSLTAITDIPSGLTYAELTDCLVEGEDELSDDEIRIAYYEFVNATATDGNVGQYERWCSGYEGIGNYKIMPLWNGANTVKVSILSASNTAASELLVNEFQEYLDPNKNGMGDGVAPIGAFVTVTTATEKAISVKANIKLVSGYSATPDIDSALVDYFASIAYEKSNVPFMNVGAVILSVAGVESISNLTVNGGTSDIALGNEEIPVKGATTWTVVS